MFKLLERLFNKKHVHCFCDKKYDIKDDKGQRIIIMACNKCGLEQIHVIKSS
jgi:translation initiation factor 2 beta subunit (eIF-2beta)/eIF-5